MTTNIVIPANILPSDGRFGSGPSLVPNLAIQNLTNETMKYMGNSHRKENVKSLVKRLQDGCHELFQLPADWEILLGNGGATTFWDALSFGGIQKKSQHFCFGEFSSRFAAVVEGAPHLENPEIISSELGTCPELIANAEVDFYALTHNETSTGVAMPVVRPDPKSSALVGVDATSAAGAMGWDPAQADIYYFSLQKAFASDGGLWVACCSPQALARFEELDESRWSPNSLNLNLARQNSQQQQILNTPAIATLYLAVHYCDWVIENDGLDWAINRSKTSSDYIYDWAEKHDFANPFVADAEQRSPVVATIVLDEKLEATQISKIFRENGIVDVEPYRKLDTNLLRFGLFPSRDPEDAKALCECIEFVIGSLS